MWKWFLTRNANIDVLYIIVFTAIGIGLVYGIDFLYRRIKRKN